MIRVSLSLLVTICLLLMLGTIFAAWLAAEWRRQRRERRAFRGVLRCRLCAFEFHDGSAVDLPRCPRCGSLTDRQQPVRL